jgi:superfamily I DNA/RNA helicase
MLAHSTERAPMLRVVRVCAVSHVHVCFLYCDCCKIAQTQGETGSLVPVFRMADLLTDKMVALFELAHTRLSTLQLEILSSLGFGASSSHVSCVVAAAGSGKTRLLSFLVGKALNEPTVQGVYLLTTTRAAKVEAQERCNALQLELGENMAAQVLRPSNVRTIHSIALFWAKHKCEDREINIVSKSAVLSMIRDLLMKELASQNDASTAPSSNPNATAFQLASADLIANMELGAAVEFVYEVRAERLRALKPVVDSSLGRTAEAVLQALELQMMGDEEGPVLFDFDALICQLALSGDAILNAGCVLFIDETQDLSLAQMTIVLNSIKAGVQVIALGDARQGIFGFSGAMPNTFKSMLQMCSNIGVHVNKVELYQNHRSTKAIVKASELFLGDDDRDGNEKITGNGKKSLPVEVALCHSEPVVVAKKIVELIKSKVYAPGDVAILRHKNFGPKDAFVLNLNEEAKKANVAIDQTVLGFDPTNSLSVRVASILRVAVGVEYFVESPDEAIHPIKAFFKALRGVSVDLSLASKAMEEVWNQVKCSPWDLFVKHNKALKDSFLMFLTQAEAKQAASSSSQPPPKRAKKLGRESQKFKNFDASIHRVSLVMQTLKQRLGDVYNRKSPLERLSVANCLQLKQGRTPRFKTLLGKLIWLIITDLVNYKFDAGNAVVDDAEIGDLVARYERDGFDDFDEFVEFLVAKTSSLLAEKTDLDLTNKVVFSTIHKFKGRERPVIFSVNLREPWFKPTWAQRATLSDLHADTCGNKSGEHSDCGCPGFTRAVKALADSGTNEKKRLKYVAASRAKAKLFLTATQGDLLPEAFKKMSPRAAFSINTWSKWEPRVLC